MSAHDEAVAIVAAATWASYGWPIENYARQPKETKEHWGKRATAAIAALRAAGFVVARVPDEAADNRVSAYRLGWNACRAAMLEGDKP